MSEVKKEGNIKLERKLYFLDGMANLLLNQIKDIKSEADSLLDYSKEDLNFYIDKIREIDNKIFKSEILLMIVATSGYITNVILK